MRHRNTVSIVIALMLVLSLLSACSGGGGGAASGGNSSGSTSTGGEKAPAGENVTIDFWHIYTEDPSKELYDQLIAEFEEAHPNIKVKQLGINFFDYFTKLQTALAGGTGPDLAIDDIGGQRVKIKSGTLVNLDPYIEASGVNVDDFFPVLIDRVRTDGEGSIYQLPLETDVRVLFYNKEAFREVGLDPEVPPKTWDELEDYAEKLTKWNDKDLIDRIGFAPKLGNLWFWTLAWTNGAKFFDEQGNPTINTPEVLETMEWWTMMQSKYGTKAFSAFQSQSGSLGFDPFIAGKVAMTVSTNNLIGDIERHKPDLDYGIAAIPYRETPATWSAGFSLEIIDNKDKAQADAAWELMKFLLSAESQKRHHQANSGLVGNMVAATDPEFIQDPNWKLITDQMEYSHFIPVPENASEWSSALNKNLDAAVAGQMTPQQAVEATQKEVEQFIKNYEATNH